MDTTTPSAQFNSKITGARQLLQARDWEHAIAAFKEIANMPGGAAAGIYGLGVIAMERNQFAKADALFSVGTELDGTNANAWYYLGRTAEVRGDLAQAAAHYTQALALRPDHLSARDADVPGSGVRGIFGSRPLAAGR